MKNTGLNRPKILVVLGPTATGKSSLAVNLAKRFDGEIISADSRQVYKGMNLGTGKITRKEMSGIKHHLIDVINPNVIFSVSRYKELAEKAIRQILAKRKLPIICGGTGFYIESIVKNISYPEVKPDYKLRAKLDKKSAQELFNILKKLSPSRAKSIDKNNKVRLIRAIEIAKALGNVPKIALGVKKYDFIQIGIDTDNKNLKNNINNRLMKRLKLGMVNEVKKLYRQGVPWKRLESFGLEYRQVAEYLQKKISYQEMIDRLKNDIWQYAKRQRTWFKRDKGIRWFKPNNQNKILSHIKKEL